jgi:hypothetical protein
LEDPNNETILDGNSVTAYNVVTCSGFSEGTTIDGFTIKNAYRNGIYCAGSPVSISNCKFVDTMRSCVRGESQSSINISNCELLGYTSVGKLYSNDSDLTITNCFMEGTGNGISCEIDSASCTVTVQDCTIQDVSYGIYCEDMDKSDSNECLLTVQDCTIRDNSSDGIYCEYVEANIINCLIEQSDDRGICSLGAPLLVSNCIVRKNGSLAGIYAFYSSSNKDYTVTIENSWICDNSASSAGIWLRFNSSYNQTAVVRNCTVVNNGTRGIYAYPENAVTVGNCILWEHDDNLFGTFSGVTYSCIEDCNDASGTGNICGEPNNPLFIDADANDFHLGPNSPCMDAGNPGFTPDANETDIDGEPRVMGNCVERVDMGGDEVFFPNCWNCPTQCHADSDCSGTVETEDWPPYRDGFMTSYPNPVYIENACGDWTRDGTIDTDDWPEYRDWFFKNPPADCNCGGTWPPE